MSVGCSGSAGRKPDLTDSAAVRRAAGIGTACAAAVALLLGVTACGAGDDHRYGTFTDCGKVGKLTTVTDPKGDQRGNLAGAPTQPQGDLLGLGLARSPGRLCAQFTVAATIKPTAAYVLVLRPQDSETPVVQLEATVLAATNPAAMLNPGGNGDGFHKIAATVGVDGDRLSVVVTRAPFAAAGVGAVFDAFRFQGRAVAVPKEGIRQTDCAPSCP